MRLQVYLCHPLFEGDVKQNIAMVDELAFYAQAYGVAPVSTHECFREVNTDSDEFVRLSKEIAEIKNRIALKKQRQMEASANENRMNEVIGLTEMLKNQPLEYDDKATRRLIDCIKVMSKNELLIIFKGGIKKTIKLGEEL